MAEAVTASKGEFAALERGVALPPFELPVSREDVAAYLESTGEQNELWERYVPPLALGAFALGGLMARFKVPGGLVHTGQEYDFLEPVPIGETVEVSISVASNSERRGARMVVFAIELRILEQVVGRGRTTVLLAPEGTEVEVLPA